MNEFFTGKRILILGGTGFIGHHLVKRLLKAGARITVLAHKASGSNLPKKKLECFAHVDVVNPVNLKSVLVNPKFHYVFNLSGYVDHGLYSQGGRAQLNVHYIGLMNLLDVLNWDCLRRFVQIGSSDEYGSAPAPQSEDSREDPIDPYSTAKVAATHLIQMLAQTENFPGVVLRFFLVYGPGQEGRRLLPTVIRHCLNNESFPSSAGIQLRDFCYIDDVVEAMLKAAVIPKAIGEVINIGSGQPVSIREIKAMIRTRIGSGRPRWGEVPYRPGENMALYADIGKAKRILHWEPKMTLEDGLTRTIKSYMPAPPSKCILKLGLAKNIELAPKRTRERP